MSAIGTRRAVLAVSLLWAVSGQAGLDTGNTRENEYRTIIDRNPFGLKPPPPPATNNPAASQPPKNDLKLTGITSFGSRKAYFMMTDKGKPEYYSLGQGEAKDGLEVLEIDDVAKSVRVRNGGIDTVMTFASHGVAAAATGPAPAPGNPGGLPGGVPNPMAPPSATTAYNMSAVPGVAPNFGGTATPARTIPSRVPRTDTLIGGMADPQMAARYGLNPGTTPAANLPVITAPVQPNPNNLSGEQQILMLELQRMATRKANPRAVLPPTPGLPGQ